MRWRWVNSGSYLNISKYFEYFSIFQVVECTLGGAGRALDQFHILWNISDKCFYTMRWRWVSPGSYLNISKYFEYFLIFQVVECTLGGAGRALDQVIAQSTATTSTQPTPLMHTKHQAPCTAHHAHFTLLTCTVAHPTTIQTVHTATTSTAPVPSMQCNAMACIATLNPAPKSFQFHPKPYSCLEWKRMRE